MLIAVTTAVTLAVLVAVYAGHGLPAMAIGFAVLMGVGAKVHWGVRRLRSRAKARGLPRAGLERFDEALRGEEMGTYSFDRWCEDADARVTCLREQAGLGPSVHEPTASD